MSNTNPRPLAEMLEAYAHKYYPPIYNHQGDMNLEWRAGFRAAVSLLLPCVEAAQNAEQSLIAEFGYSRYGVRFKDLKQALSSLRDKLESK